MAVSNIVLILIVNNEVYYLKNAELDRDLMQI